MLGELYGALLGMERYDAGYVKLRSPDGARPEIGFENGDDVRPRWPDPAYPQQLHLDIEVEDMEAADGLARRHGAELLRDNGDRHRIYADPVGHPFCLYPAPGRAPGRLARIVFDCPSPHVLAGFYAELLPCPTARWTPRTWWRSRAARRSRGWRSNGPRPGPRWPDPATRRCILDLSFDEPTMRRVGAGGQGVGWLVVERRISSRGEGSTTPRLRRWLTEPHGAPPKSGGQRSCFDPRLSRYRHTPCQR